MHMNFVSHEEVQKQEVVMNKAGITELDRPCVMAARKKEEESRSFFRCNRN